jgi:hypothetical protein
MRGGLQRRFTLKEELLLALLPTGIVLVVLVLVEFLSRQRVLFASLAASAFLIYLEPHNPANSVRSLVLSHIAAAGLGLVTYLLLGGNYLSGGLASRASRACNSFPDWI